jgi:hypothetical protein
VLAYRHGSSDAGAFNTVSYNANFTSTSGILSAQFGLHYINFSEKGYDGAQHGISGGGVALLEFPVAERYDNGIPRAALAPYFGGVPSGFFSGERNTLTVPFVIGFGVPLSPAKAITLTPWYEFALSANLDTTFKPANITVDASDFNGQQVKLDAEKVRELVGEGVDMEFSFVVPMRAGLDVALHLSNVADLNAYSMLSTLGGGFSGDLVTTFGFAFAVRWDNIVPAVLPPEKRLQHEDCGAIEERFRSCPNSRAWTAPHGTPRGVPETVNAPATPPSVPSPNPVPAPAPTQPLPGGASSAPSTPPNTASPSAAPVPVPSAPAPSTPPTTATPESKPPSAAFPE